MFFSLRGKKLNSALFGKNNKKKERKKDGVSLFFGFPPEEYTSMYPFLGSFEP